MHNAPTGHLDERQKTQDLIVDVIADGTVLVGTLLTLSQSLGVKVADLRTALRELLEARTIAVSTEARGQLTIRLERRRGKPHPDLPPAVERRRPAADNWIV
jgi:hypothetical protein